MFVEPAEKTLTAVDYFEFEKHSETRHEYHLGKLLPMPGESLDANTIAQNILEKLRRMLLPQGYRLFLQSIKAEIQAGGIYRYPDLMVAHVTDVDDEYVIRKPILLVEVASSDSYRRDRAVKYREYTALASLQYYLIIHQEEMMVEFFFRQGESWATEIFLQPENRVDLPLFGLHLLLADIYEFVILDKYPPA